MMVPPPSPTYPQYQTYQESTIWTACILTQIWSWSFGLWSIGISLCCPVLFAPALYLFFFFLNVRCAILEISTTSFHFLSSSFVRLVNFQAVYHKLSKTNLRTERRNSKSYLSAGTNILVVFQMLNTVTRKLLSFVVPGNVKQFPMLQSGLVQPALFALF